MKSEVILPERALNKAYNKEKVGRVDIENFKAEFRQLLSRINENESEEHLKNVISDFLKDTWYKGKFAINTKDRKDLVIHNGKSTNDSVGVIIEVKRPSNKTEMFSVLRPNSKSIHELVLYYLRERIDNNNHLVKNLIITNIYEWYIIDEVWFDYNVFRNKNLVSDYESWKLSGKDTRFFYEVVAKAYLESIDVVLPVTYFDIRGYRNAIENENSSSELELLFLYKIISPSHLLKHPFGNDSNSLDSRFYSELLHIIGLEEVTDGNRKYIRRKAIPDSASLIENAIIKIEDKDCLADIPRLTSFGDNKEDRLYNIALELCITWINRILFLKLLEAQLTAYNNGDHEYLFLNSSVIFDYDELSNLFFQVLAERPTNRRTHVREKYKKVPYLNSSLFERTELERYAISIGELDNRFTITLYPDTVLKDERGVKRKEDLPTLRYLLEFLNAFDFTSVGGARIQEDNKSLINAAVLGLIFEKINGYKEGAYFTPGFVTMQMCRNSVRNSVLQRFNVLKGWDCKDFISLYNKIDDKVEANEIINEIKICDPAVGSGHFLVSALNELLAIKSDLRILLDNEGRSLKDYNIEVVNDELLVYDLIGKPFEYTPSNRESQRVQMALFHEKEKLIENCLFGVDINQNSVKICRLRLWIELLKNAYYTSESNFSDLETLPNIDINIKCGNSLVSRFDLELDIAQALKNPQKWTIESYKLAVQAYRSAESKEEKRSMEDLINLIKNDFKSHISPNDPKYKRLSKLRGELFNISQSRDLFDQNRKIGKEARAKINKLNSEINKLEKEIDEIKNNVIYSNAFEWRFEFPEVLNENGKFEGFDIVIGNPPYLTGSSFREYRDFFIKNYYTAEYQLDLYSFFIELSVKILKKDGWLTLITPNSWLKNIRMLKTREFVLKNLGFESINPNISKVFQEAHVDTLIFSAVKMKAFDETRVWSFDKQIVKDRHRVRQNDFWDNEGLVFDVEVGLDIRRVVRKIRSLSKNLEDDFDITRGVNPYDKYRGQSEEVILTKAYHASYAKDDTFRPEIRGKHVGTFFYRWDDKHFISYGDWLAAPRDPKYFTGNRIVFREVLSSRFATTVIEEDFIIDRSLYIAKPLNEGVDVYYNLGIISSKLLIWIFRKEKNEYDDLFPKIRLEEFRKLPIPKICKYKKELSGLVRKIVTLKERDFKVDLSEYERTLDNLVYEIYDLSLEEISLMNGIE